MTASRPWVVWILAAWIGAAPVWASDRTTPPSAVPAPGAATDIAPHPVMQVERREVDVGAVREGTEVLGTFQIKNVGDAELRIISAKPG